MIAALYNWSKVKCLALFILYTAALSAQKEDHIWLFNWHPYDDVSMDSIRGASVLDFNTLPPRAYKDEAITLDFIETNSFYSDSSGQLSLYTNGQAVYGADHQPIINGDTINYGRVWDIWTWANEAGQVVPNGFRITQGITLIPMGNTTERFIVLYKNGDIRETIHDPFDLWYSMIEKTDTGAYQVTQKDSFLLESIYLRGDVHACRHGNGRDWWVLQFSRNSVYTYLVDPDGIHLDDIQYLNQAFRTGFSMSSYSADGSKFAISVRAESDMDTGVDLMIADFDRCSGRLENEEFYRESSHNTGFGYGVEFSPDGNLLYGTTGNNIYQFDLRADDFQASKISVGEYDGSLCSHSQGSLFFGRPLLAPDHKIYIGSIVQCFNISVINHPNVRGRGCDFQHNVIEKPTFTNNTLPNVNTWRLGPLDGSACDTLGRDNHPVSRFWYEQDSSDFLTIQFWDVSYFRPEIWEWTFGDGGSSTEREPLHSFTEKGIYEVCLTVSNENSRHTSCQELNLGITSTTETAAVEIDLSIFPNPTDDFLRITFHDYLPQEASIFFYALTGQQVHRERIYGGVNVLDLTALPTGTYFYEIWDQGAVLDRGQQVIVD